jgi:hypothetical protein
LVVWVLARVLVLVREVVVALLRIEERSEAEVDVREARDERGVKRIDGGGCDVDGGGGGGGTRRVVVVVDDVEDIDRMDIFGEVGAERGGGDFTNGSETFEEGFGEGR